MVIPKRLGQAAEIEAAPAGSIGRHVLFICAFVKRVVDVAVGGLHGADGFFACDGRAHERYSGLSGNSRAGRLFEVVEQGVEVGHEVGAAAPVGVKA